MTTSSKNIAITSFTKSKKQLLSLFSLARKSKIYSKKYKKISKRFFPNNYGELTELPTINRTDFYGNSLDEFNYLMKSRIDSYGNEPIVPLTKKEYDQMVGHEAYKFSRLGNLKKMRCAIVAFTINHTIPMAEALMKLGGSYVVLEGHDELCFQDVIDKKIELIFTNIRWLEKFIEYVRQKKLLTSLKYVLTAGEKVNSLKETRLLVKKYLNAEYRDSIGTRELGGFSLSCPTHDYYHFLDQNQFVEVADATVAKNEYRGELVITPLWRSELPLLRYSTGDIVRCVKRKKCSCRIFGNLAFLGIDGRVDEKIKIGFALVNFQDLQNEIVDLLLFQLPFDRLIWKLIGPPKIDVTIKQDGGEYLVCIFVNKFKYFIALRRFRLIREYIYDSTGTYPRLVLK